MIRGTTTGREAFVAALVFDGDEISAPVAHEIVDSASARVRRSRRPGGDHAEADSLLVGQGDLDGKVELPTEVIVRAIEDGILCVKTPCVGHVWRASRWGEVQELESPGPLTSAAWRSTILKYTFAGQDDLEPFVGPDDGRDAFDVLVSARERLAHHTHFEAHVVVDFDEAWIISRAVSFVLARDADGRGR